MTAWNDILNPKFLGSWDVPENSTLKLRIKSAYKEMVDNFKTNKKEEKLIISFYGNYKPMVVNITNAKAISFAVKSKMLEDWQEKFIEVGTKSIRAFGETTLALRVKDTQPKIEVLNKTHSRYNAAVDSLKSKKTTIESIKTTYIINELELKKDAGF
jgi:inosine-uridine nucleoside N-ribohydrolase